MKKQVLFLVFFVLLSLGSIAQGVYLSDISGKPINEKNNSQLDLSTYFNDEYLIGSITMSDHTVFNNIYLRYDLESNQLTYRKPNSLISMLPYGRIAKFTVELLFSKVSFINFFKGEEGKDDYYQVLYDGPISLLKKVQKQIVENVEYNSTSKTKSVKTLTNYFLFNKQLAILNLIKQEKKLFVKSLGNDELLNNYISSEKLNLKKEDDMIKLMIYFNSLKL